MLRRHAHRAVCFACALSLVLLSMGIGVATPAGVQCPTAPMQLIRVAIKEKCGCVRGFVERAPRPGEKGFLQCRCAEKKAPKATASVPKFESFTVQTVNFRFANRIVTPERFTFIRQRADILSYPPRPQPPNCIS